MSQNSGINRIRKLLQSEKWLSAENIKTIEDGLGFRVNDYRFVSLPAENAGEELVSTDGRLRVVASVKAVESTVVISNTITNIGSTPLPPIHLLEPLFLTFNHPCDSWRHIYWAGGTADGGYPPKAYSRNDQAYCRYVRIESHAGGRSSNLHIPLLMSLFSGQVESEGFICGLEWSGLWYMEFTKNDEKGSRLSAGIKVNGIVLDPGETLDLPDVHICFFKGGPAEGGNMFRRYIYNHVGAKHQNTPVIPAVSCNHWQSELQVKSLMAQADRAVRAGIEVYVVDAGWFPGDFPMGVGNWDRVDTGRFPEGMEDFADYIRKLGMELGLWFEPERAAENTTLVNQHPDWFLPGGEGRNYHLNLALTPVRQYLIDMLGEYIERLDLRWIKWDYNIDPFPFWEAADHTLKIQFAYIQGLYEVLDMLMSKYPKLRIEGCASGGRRIDLGIIKRSHTLWLSDAYFFYHNPLLSRYMQARANAFLPGHLLLTWVSAKPCQKDGGVGHVAILSRMLGHLGFNGDVAKWTKEQTERTAFWVNVYKKIRHLMDQRFYQLLPSPSSMEDWDALQFVDDCSMESILFVFSGNAAGRQRIVLKGLAPDWNYTVTDYLKNKTGRHAGRNLTGNGFPVDLPAFGGGLWKITRECPAAGFGKG